MRKNGKQISEKAFCDFYKRVLEFCYDGSAMREQQDQLYAHAVLLSTSDEPEECPVTNPDYYFQKARDLMIQRKEEIKQRLLDSDDAPSRRRELRAEMKGIDYCISVLDENH